MTIRVHPHARTRMEERGATEEEVHATVEAGERLQAKLGRVGFRRNFAYNSTWRGRFFATKQVEAIAIEEDGWLAITVVFRFFRG